MINKTIQQAKAIGKSSEELIEEARSVVIKSAAAYVPLISKAISEENPNFQLMEIHREVFKRCGDIWKKHTIEQNWGDFARTYEKTGKYKGIAATKKAEQTEQISRVFEKIPEPKGRKEEEFTPVSEEVDAEMHELGIGKFGNTGKSLRELKGDILGRSADLFEALTQKHIPYDDNEDLLVDYIKPTREFRRGLILELDETDRTSVHNWLHYTSVAIEDMLEIIKEAEEK
jgi:putative lipoic acid-binding regulatory protein